MPTREAAIAHVDEMREIRRRNAAAQAYIAKIQIERRQMAVAVAGVIAWMLIGLVLKALGIESFQLD